MDCERIREAASARLDGEPLGMPASALDEHLARCADCAHWVERSAVLTRRLRVRPVSVPDLSDAILAAAPLPRPRRTARRAVRAALAVAGLFQLVLAAVAVFGDSVGMAMGAHAMHESAAWNGGLGLAFLLVAARPRWAAGSLPAVLGFVVILTPLAVHDLAVGVVSVDRLATHLGSVLGALLMVGLARPDRTAVPDPARRAGTGPSGERPRLRGAA